MPPFPVRPAEALMDAAFLDRWRDREAIGPAARGALRAVLERLVATGSPVESATLPDPGAVDELHARDLLLARDGRVLLAYPLSGVPTPFVVRLADGRERHAVCAVDALGVASLLDTSVRVAAPCHHCGAPVEVTVGPDGAGGMDDAMVWVGERDPAARASASL